MADIFNEANMRETLKEYIPAGEVLLAGIHAIAKETMVTGIFGKCIRTEDSLVPDENGGTVALKKRKYSTYDIYFGITQSSFLIVGCEKHSYLYQFKDDLRVREEDIQELASELSFDDIGTCYPLTDIQKCEIKKGWMGSVKCHITMKNGSYFKLLLPKLGGLGGGMSHHAEYRQAIIARLGGGSV